LARLRCTPPLRPTNKRYIIVFNVSGSFTARKRLQVIPHLVGLLPNHPENSQ
jgi:hypothetical protein